MPVLARVFRYQRHANKRYGVRDRASLRLVGAARSRRALVVALPPSDSIARIAELECEGARQRRPIN